MKVSKEKAAENRERILTEAARLFRESGMDGVGVDALAAAAGLTYGSLYSQFGSKERLMVESLDHGYAQIEARTSAMPAAVGPDEVAARYLSSFHRDNPGTGCFMAALACDMPRQSEGVRASFTAIVKSRAAWVGRLLSGRKQLGVERVEDEALGFLATMVGGMVLARAVNDAEFSERILAASRARLAEVRIGTSDES